MRILGTYNIKGGVGKTATAVNLAWLAAREGARTLVWDLDPQGAATFYFRVKPKVKGGGEKLLKGKRELAETVRGTDFEGLDLVPADFSYRNLDVALTDFKKPAKQLMKLLRPLSESYDYLFLDCAPSISMVSESVFYAADALLVPLIPTTLSLRTYDQLRAHLRDSPLGRLKLMPFFSMVDRRKRLHRETLEHEPQRRPELLAAHIPYSSLVEQMGIHRAPLGGYAPHSVPAQAYAQLWSEIRAGLADGGVR